MGDTDSEVLFRYDGGTSVWGTRVSRGFVSPPYHVRSPDDDIIAEFEESSYQSVTSYAALVDRYGGTGFEDGDVDIPVEIAIEGKPAIATYLHGVCGWSRQRIANTFGIKERSVLKQLQRFRPERKWVD